MSTPITRNFGTPRGLVRLGLSYIERSPEIAPAPAEVRRLVFVCHGNICRSAFAEAAARDLGLNAASFGLSTSSGKSAHPPAAEIAAQLGHPLSAHQTTRLEDFVLKEGDYLLAMEHRHIRKLATIAVLAVAPRGLLGRYASPAMPHLHDPYRLDPLFMEVCLKRVAAAVDGLARSFPGAWLS